MCIRDSIYPDDEELFRSHFQKIVDGEAEAVGEYRILKADESFIWCRITASAIRDDNAKLQKVIGMISDIDEQKRKVFFAQEQAMRDTLTGLYNRCLLYTSGCALRGADWEDRYPVCKE